MKSILAPMAAGLLMISNSSCQWQDESDLKPELEQGGSSYQIVTGEDADDEKSRWDSYLKKKGFVYGKEPERYLTEKVEGLKPGRVLDLACAEGRNSVFLAKKGFQVDGVDISEVALRKVRAFAKEEGVKVHTIAADLRTYQIPADTYDLIISFDFLYRPLFLSMKRGVKKGGMIIFESHTEAQLENDPGGNPRRDWLLKPGELKKIFSDFEILDYRETNDGKNALASIVAKRR
jgi:SAM-dependent methyltransferase